MAPTPRVNHNRSGSEIVSGGPDSSSFMNSSSSSALSENNSLTNGLNTSGSSSVYGGGMNNNVSSMMNSGYGSSYGYSPYSSMGMGMGMGMFGGGMFGMGGPMSMIYSIQSAIYSLGALLELVGASATAFYHMATQMLEKLKILKHSLMNSNIRKYLYQKSKNSVILRWTIIFGGSLLIHLTTKLIQWTIMKYLLKGRTNTNFISNSSINTSNNNSYTSTTTTTNNNNNNNNDFVNDYLQEQK